MEDTDVEDPVESHPPASTTEDWAAPSEANLYGPLELNQAEVGQSLQYPQAQPEPGLSQEGSAGPLPKEPPSLSKRALGSAIGLRLLWAPPVLTLVEVGVREQVVEDRTSSQDGGCVRPSSRERPSTQRPPRGPVQRLTEGNTTTVPSTRKSVSWEDTASRGLARQPSHAR